MLEHSSLEFPQEPSAEPPRYTNTNLATPHLKYSHQHHTSLEDSRKKLHQLMSQNYQLTEEISLLQEQLKQAYANEQVLKEKLRAALGELEACDRAIEQSREIEGDLKEKIAELEEQVGCLQSQLQVKCETLSSLTQHNYNLQTQIRMVSELKQKYQTESSRFKLEAEVCREASLQLEYENQSLKQELARLKSEIEVLEHDSSIREGEMQQYESFVLEKIAAAQNAPEVHEKCRAETDKWHCKYLKYRERARAWKTERDELLGHLATLSQEVGSSSMRAYVG